MAPPRLITVFRTDTPSSSDRHFRPGKSHHCFFNITFLFHSCLASSLSFHSPSFPRHRISVYTNRPALSAPPASPIALKHPLDSSHSETRWHTSRCSLNDQTMPSLPGLNMASSSMCTPLHPCPLHRRLSPPLRGFHIIPNQTWRTSPSLTSQRRMVPPCGS